ncbi:hypothetical protein BJ508DRAFT_415902 [Ascobolus immersus RN42]|uniref:Uncharacterized protein n=1 Tax=Ascobolus immersus RN42 TaxID=1160509 RepID=A0A3N4I0C3_ASCIM|nr:hypothetical protein BJ508DRAFT_415902 [Ascobolus immersus RN42]
MSSKPSDLLDLERLIAEEEAQLRRQTEASELRKRKLAARLSEAKEALEEEKSRKIAKLHSAIQGEFYSALGHAYAELPTETVDDAMREWTQTLREMVPIKKVQETPRGPVTREEMAATCESWPWRKRCGEFWIPRLTGKIDAKLSDAQEETFQIAAVGEPRPDYTCEACKSGLGAFRWCLFRKVVTLRNGPNGKPIFIWDPRGCANCVQNGKQCEAVEE